MAIWNAINYTDIKPDRFDAEYHSKPHKNNIKILQATGDIVSLGRLFKYINRGEQPLYDPKGTIRVLRSVNVGKMTFNNVRQEYVTTDFLNKTSRGRVIQNDILITSTGVGTLGRTSIWHDSNSAFCDGHITIVRGTDKNPYFITAYLNCKYGLLQFEQNLRGSSGQIEIYPSDIEKILIPEFLFEYQNEIGEYVKKAFELKELSKSLYDQAEKILARELKLDKIALSLPKWYSADYSEVITSSRFDGEYFSPVIKNILSQSFLQGKDTIGSLFHIIRGCTPKSYLSEGIPVVKTKNVRTPDIDKDRIEDYASQLDTSVLTKENDLVIASMGVGSLGRISYITSDSTDFTIDGTLRIFRRKDHTADNIEIPTMLFLSSEIGQKLIYRGVVGSTGIISITDDYLATIPIPILNESVRKQLTELVLKSIQAQTESTNLLVRAKKRVEELIEQEARKN